MGVPRRSCHIFIEVPVLLLIASALFRDNGRENIYLINGKVVKLLLGDFYSINLIPSDDGIG